MAVAILLESVTAGGNEDHSGSIKRVVRSLKLDWFCGHFTVHCNALILVLKNNIELQQQNFVLKEPAFSKRVSVQHAEEIGIKT